MKRISMLLFLCLFATPAFAFHLGPASPAPQGHEAVKVGAGYFFYQAEWENVDIEQNRAYLHAGYLMGIEDEPRWEIFVRGGGADLEINRQFDSDFKPFGAVGVKGAFYEGRYFGWGLVFQGAYFGRFSSNGFNIRNMWEIEGGLPFQLKLGPAIFYAGPMAFGTQAKLENGAGGSRNISEDRDFGGFGGIAIDLGPMRLEAEAQYKTDFSGGGFVSFRF
jgi:hypothetical protein